MCGYIQESARPPKDIHICENCGEVDISLFSADLYKFPINSIKRILNNELLRRNLGDSVGVIYFWKTREGKIIELHAMSTQHIEYLLSFLERKTLESALGF